MPGHSVYAYVRSAAGESVSSRRTEGAKPELVASVILFPVFLHDAECDVVEDEREEEQHEAQRKGRECLGRVEFLVADKQRRDLDGDGGHCLQGVGGEVGGEARLGPGQGPGAEAKTAPAATAPAKIYNLHPRKGSIAIGVASVPFTNQSRANDPFTYAVIGKAMEAHSALGPEPCIGEAGSHRNGSTQVDRQSP